MCRIDEQIMRHVSHHSYRASGRSPASLYATRQAKLAPVNEMPLRGGAIGTSVTHETSRDPASPPSSPCRSRVLALTHLLDPKCDLDLSLVLVQAVAQPALYLVAPSMNRTAMDA